MDWPQFSDTHLSVLIHLCLRIIRDGGWVEEVEEAVRFHLRTLQEWLTSVDFSSVLLKRYLLGNCAHTAFALVLLLFRHLVKRI